MKIKIHNLTGFASPRDYVLDEALEATVELAIALNKPLLVTGAPGTGKTQLAHKIAYELSKNSADSKLQFLEKPWIFNTKTTSTARDLFYQYDAIGHFQRKGADSKEDVSVSDYIQLNALGAAIVQTRVGSKVETADSKHEADARLGSVPPSSDSAVDTKMEEAKKHSELKRIEDQEVMLRKISQKKLKSVPMSSVVLIDEIDKAPRDFPNDLLNEVENYQFYISELDLTVKAASPKDARIIIIMTSNFEKNLPPAFLRRCLFYHIPTPQGEGLLKIVVSRMKDFLKQRKLELTEAQIRERYEGIVKLFDQLGGDMNDKAPATAELLEWLRALELKDFFDNRVVFDKLTKTQKDILQYTFPILAKSKDDIDRLAKIIK